jgi:hypothetical protein
MVQYGACGHPDDADKLDDEKKAQRLKASWKSDFTYQENEVHFGVQCTGRSDKPEIRPHICGRKKDYR